MCKITVWQVVGEILYLSKRFCGIFPDLARDNGADKDTRNAYNNDAA